MKWRVCIECGQSLWRFTSWFGHKYPGHPYRRPKFRSLNPGFAYGPVMVYKKGSYS